MERKSIWWAYGFLLFFGTFGVHRFYLDRPVSGVLYFLTAGFAGIGIVYDIFAMPFLVASANQ